MSNRITKLCRPLRMSAVRKAVLMCLADFARDDGKDWHSVAAIMEWTCLGRRTIFEAMEWLEGQGLITVQRRLGAKNTTFLQLDRIEELSQQFASRTALDDEPVRQPHGLADETSAPGAPLADVDPCAGRTDPCAGRTPTSAPGALTSAPGAPEALKASMKHQKASGVAAPVGTAPTGDLFPGSAGADPEPAHSLPALTKGLKPKPAAKSAATWDAYSTAWRARHGAEPMRGATVNSQLAKLVDAAGEDEAPRLAAFFVSMDRPAYVSRMHPVAMLLQDAQSIRAQMLTGRAAPELETWQERGRASAAARVAEFAPGVAARPTHHRRQVHDFTDINYREGLPSDHES